MQERITITFIDQILFSSGRAALNRKGKEALDKVGRSFYEPVAGNDTPEGRTRNRHSRQPA